MIIPTLNEADQLPLTLKAIGKNWAGANPEIIVADGGSTDNTVRVARSFGVIIVNSPAGRAKQLNAGAARATGQWLYFLHADTLPPANLFLHLRHAAQHHLPAAFPIRFDQEQQSLWLSLFSRLSEINIAAFRFGDQSLFVSQEDFHRAGGYREDYLLMEGYDLAKRLRKDKGGFNLLAGHVTTSARRYLLHGVLYTQLVFSLIFLLHQVGVGQLTLKKIYQQAFRSHRRPATS